MVKVEKLLSGTLTMAMTVGIVRKDEGCYMSDQACNWTRPDHDKHGTHLQMIYHLFEAFFESHLKDFNILSSILQ